MCKDKGKGKGVLKDTVLDAAKMVMSKTCWTIVYNYFKSDSARIVISSVETHERKTFEMIDLWLACLGLFQQGADGRCGENGWMPSQIRQGKLAQNFETCFGDRREPVQSTVDCGQR